MNDERTAINVQARRLLNPDAIPRMSQMIFNHG